MNKELKKTIEAELNLLITDCLNKRNKKSADEIARHIKDAARHVARKFVKHLPESKPKDKPVKAASAAGKKKAEPAVKAAAKKKTAAKKKKAVKAKK